MHWTRGKKRTAIGTALIATAALVTATVMAASGAPAQRQATASGPETHANLAALNNSGVTGNADVTVDGRRLEVDLDARHLLKGMPHAEHIHFGKQARQECPTVRDDDNADHRLTTVEGLPAYGPVRVSLTTHGDTSPKSTLAVKRYPTAPHHQIHYNRKGIEVSKRVARAIRHGKAVLVIHGIDYNHNGKYDFSAGKSDLDPNLPAEATDPAACGILKVVPSTSTSSPTPTPLPVVPKQPGKQN